MELAWSTILKNLQVSKMTGGSTGSGTTDEDSEGLSQLPKAKLFIFLLILGYCSSFINPTL